MTKKPQQKKETIEVAVTKEENSNSMELFKTYFLLEKILEACGDIKKSVDALAERFGGGY